MPLPKKASALAAGIVAAVSIAALAQDPAAPPRGSADRARQIVVGGSIDWVEKSDVSAQKEGVIYQIEAEVGQVVNKGDTIGHLNDRMAELTEAKAKLASENMGEIMKAKAQRALANNQMARNQRLKRRAPGSVSIDEEEKAEAEVAVAEALFATATEQKMLAKADYELAKQARAEHVIIAPFSGVITDRMKSRGESVRANEPVVRLGRIDKFRFVGWIPLETAVRLKGNEVVEVHPVIDGADLKIEDQKFRGKLKSISREINPVHGTEVQILAEIDNPTNPNQPELELRQGMKAEMLILLDSAPAKVAATRGTK